MDGAQNPFVVDNKSLLIIKNSNKLFKIVFFYLRKLFMHFCNFVNIMFGLRFLCVTCESYFESPKVNS